MNIQEIADALEESDFLRKVESLRNRNEQEVLAAKDSLRSYGSDSEIKFSEKVFYVSAIYSVVFLWTLMFIAPYASLLGAAFTYPLLGKKNPSEGWRWVGYAIVSIAFIVQFASLL